MQTPSLLVIDDDQDTLRVLVRILEREGFTARSTTSSEEALRLLSQEPYEGILCDVWMPGLNGIELYSHLKKNLPQYRDRFIFVTGDVASEYTWDFIEERRLPYILKPFNPQLIGETLTQVFGARLPEEPPPDPNVEKRANKRNALKAAVRLRRQKFDPSGPDNATTVNFTKDGLLLISEQKYRVGMDVWVIFPYMKGQEGPEQDGYVVRVEDRDAGKQAVALALGENAQKCRQAAQVIDRRSRQIVPLELYQEDQDARIAARATATAEAEKLKAKLVSERQEIRRLADDLADVRQNLLAVSAERDRLAEDEQELSRQLRELASAKAAASETLEGLKQQMQQLEGQLVLHEQYRYQAIHDGLTGVLNRAAIFDNLHKELSRAQREKTFVGVILADLDHFKRVNDTHGHLAGDAVLKEAAQRFAGALRGYDSIGRYGGEEFLLILPGCDAESAMRQAERVRAAVAETPVKAEGSEIHITVSLGVAASNDPASMEALLRSADAALYQAKEGGRNRVVLATTSTTGTKAAQAESASTAGSTSVFEFAEEENAPPAPGAQAAVKEREQGRSMAPDGRGGSREGRQGIGRCRTQRS